MPPEWNHSSWDDKILLFWESCCTFLLNTRQKHLPRSAKEYETEEKVHSRMFLQRYHKTSENKPKKQVFSGTKTKKNSGRKKERPKLRGSINDKVWNLFSHPLQIILTSNIHVTETQDEPLLHDAIFALPTRTSIRPAQSSGDCAVV